MSLVYPEESEKLPNVLENYEGFLVLTEKLKMESGEDLLISFVLEGEAEQ